jgi:hypothetical protein
MANISSAPSIEPAQARRQRGCRPAARWRKGYLPNPDGTSVTSQDDTVETLLEGEAEALTRKAIEIR